MAAFLAEPADALHFDHHAALAASLGGGDAALRERLARSRAADPDGGFEDLEAEMLAAADADRRRTDAARAQLERRAADDAADGDARAAKVAALEAAWADEEAQFFREWGQEEQKAATRRKAGGGGGGGGGDGDGADAGGGGGAGGIDFILAADCISSDVYSAESWRLLARTIGMLCTPGVTRAFVAAERRPGDGLDGFLALCDGRDRGGGGGGDEGFSMYGSAPLFSECALVHEEERGGATFEIYRLSID